jgi:hypothetical protein
MGRLRSKRKNKLRQENQEERSDGNDNEPTSLCITSSSKLTRKSQLSLHGVRLKHFEQVLVELLPKIQLHYVTLPSMQRDGGENERISSFVDLTNDSYPFSVLPTSVRVWGDAPGQLKNAERAERKEGQLQSMMRCLLPFIRPSSDTSSPFTIVDFGGGSGHLGIPLALLLPQCCIIVVDFNGQSIQLMHEKVERVIQQIHDEGTPDDLLRFTASNVASQLSVKMRENPMFRCCAGQANSPGFGILCNLFSFQGPIEQFREHFDLALALHLCGEATDVAIRKAVDTHAAAMVLAPCCVGKLSQKALNPDVFNATGYNESAVSYPQSCLFRKLMGTNIEFNDKRAQRNQRNDWDALAKAADYSNEQECRTSRNATRRTAKAFVETDRRLFLEEQNVNGSNGYRTALTKMEPLEVSPKNDILVAWRQDIYGKDVEELFSVPNRECQSDVEVAMSHLLATQVDGSTTQNDWTYDEEDDIQSTIQEFLERTKDSVDYMDQVYLFPTQMGARKRKLIHFVAGKLDLAHWSHGAKDSLKTVAVARRGQRKRTQQVDKLESQQP